VVHRWPGWVPWVVFGGGLVAVGAGALVEGIASAKMTDYDRAIARDCAATGCNPVPAADQALEDSARTYSAIGAGAIITGVATAAVGGALLYLNRGRIVYRNVEVHGAGTLAVHF
jgi:hypothetical protein